MQQKRLGVEFFPLSGSQFGEHRRLGLFQHAIQPPEHSEWQNDLAVLGLFVVTSQQLGDGPDEGRKVGVAHGASSVAGVFA